MMRATLRRVCSCLPGASRVCGIDSYDNSSAGNDQLAVQSPSDPPLQLEILGRVEPAMLTRAIQLFGIAALR